MAWRPAFLEAIASGARAPKMYLESRQVYREPGTPYRIASHLGLGADLVCIGTSADGGPMVNVQGSTLSPRGWKTTIGAFSVGIVGNFSEPLARFTRGTVVVLYAGFDGMHVDDFEPIAIGQVQNVRGMAPMWTLECWTLDNAMRQRLDVTAALTQLFATLGNGTTLAAAYSPGDTSIEVASTANFDRETSGTGALKIGEFYLTYTGTATSPTRFTGVSVAAVGDTTADSAGSGDAVEEAVWLTGHPMDIARKILCSRDGTNGDYDTLPTGWGLGFSSNLVDHDDIDRYVTDVVAVETGSYVWDLIYDEPVDDALAEVTGLLAFGGMFITTRQGLLTIRAAQSTRLAPYHSGIEITDEDVDTIESYEAFDYSFSPEYTRVSIRSLGVLRVSAADETPATLPAAESLPYDLTHCLFANDLQVAYEMLDRLEESALRVPERLVLRCAGLRLAQLAPGDVVDFSCTRTHSRRDGALGWDGRRAMIVEVSPNWHGGTVRIGLLVYPTTGDAFA